jgi:hypothetical protein
MVIKYQAPIVKKAFVILDAISKSTQGLRISEISSRLDISKSTVHGIGRPEDVVLSCGFGIQRYTIGLPPTAWVPPMNGSILKHYAPS